MAENPTQIKESNSRWDTIFREDPTACLQEIEDSLGVSFGNNIGVQSYSSETISSNERRYGPAVGLETYETIRSIERLASFLIRHGCLKSNQLGEWLTEQTIVLNGSSPAGYLLCDLSDDGSFREDKVEDVLVAAEQFLNPFSFEDSVVRTWQEHNR